MSDQPIQIGDFRIEKQIGAGGMGIVYLARQISLDRLVALKVLGQSLTRQSDKARFQRAMDDLVTERARTARISKRCIELPLRSWKSIQQPL